MPRKKKNGQSPARAPSGGPLEEGGSLGHNNTAYGLPQRGLDGASMTASQTSSSVVKSMQEMFSHLDPEVIYIVLSECDFKVEHAMDSLLELSVAAEVAAPTPSHVSGFERTAAALLSPCHFTEPRPDPDSNESSSPSTDLLTDELDLLVDQELETLTAQRSMKDEHHQYLSVGSSLSSLPPPPLPQQVLPELLQSSLQSGPKGPSGGGQVERTPGASSPLNQLSRWGENVVDERRDERQSALDFSHLITEADKPPLDLANSGRPSAFQVYKKQEPSNPPPLDQAGLSQPIFGGARSKNVLNQMPLSYMSSPWNPAAAAFSPRLHGNQGPAFITPVAHTTSNWPGRPRQASPWLARAQAPLKPSATIPKSWALPAAPHPPAQSNRLRLEGRVLVLLRGAPGSGKSTLARALLEHNPGGVALSTDNYFSRHGAYQYDPAALGEAHEWNHKQAVEAFERGANPIIIDNTNMQGWEMKPYVAQALKHGYKVLFKEPDTWWKNKPRELERRTAHNVPVEKIRRMLTYYERYVTVQSIMGSRAPERKPPSPLETSDSSCPDLVGLPGVTEGGHRPGPQLCSSLPDVSSIGRSKVGMHEDGAYKSTESLNFQPSGNPLENSETDNMDLGELDAVLDLNRPVGDQRIPDCIVESVVSDEMPVAFSESIAQRVKRERPRGSSVSDRLEPADVVKDTKQSNGEAKETDQAKEAERGEMVRDEGERGMEFEGDWPCEASLEQRRVRRREGNAQEEEGASAKANKTQPGPNVKEFQKLLDLIQTGVADIQVGSHSSSLSQSSREEEEEEGGSRSSSRSELPDCVLDWKDSFRVREQRPENEASSTAGATDTAVQAAVCGDERHGAEGEAATAPDDRTESSRETVAECDGSQACPSPVDAESGASQERKQRQGRRSGKQCKLALTFTQNCPQNTPNTAAQSTNNTEPDCDTRLGVKTNSELSTEPESIPLVDPGRSTQTDPQDFALLWRLNQPEHREDAGDTTVLSGNSSRFVPEVSSAVSAAVAVDPSGHREVPYHVLHEKGTQVEEKELGAGQDRLEDLRILSRHFKLVSFDTLEDLYEKCHHDLEWTTNLLLDSGERFFRADDEGEQEEDDEAGALDELHPGGMLPGVEDTQESNFGAASQSDGSTNNADVPCFGGANEAPDTTSQTSEPSRPPAADGAQPSDHKVSGEDGAGSGSSDDGVIVEESRVEVEMEEEMASMDEANRLLQAELEEMEQQQKREERRSADLDIKSVELKLPTELALQLTELFGPVGVDPASCSTDDYAVQMDLNLAKLLHQKWKESLQEKQRQATLAFHLLQESSAPWGEQRSRSGSRERAQPSRFHGNADGSDAQLPFMDHWNVSRPHVSLRDIIKEEQAMQANVAKTRQSRADLDRRDGAALLKENQLYQLFPGIDRHFLQDIFRDHNYSLTQTELFLRSLLEEEPVKTVIAPETPRSDLRAASKDREKRQKAMEKAMECALPNYQDTEDPEYQDFRAEASQQRSRQLECFSKAAEAFKQGHKEVASFYAQQGHLHGQRMREANHRAAVQIFQRVNSSLLPRNILDLHGLHVDEALQHLAQVLQDKTTACEQGLCRPQLSVITGRGNHSQGGVARIRPAVIDYLTNKHYRFTEPKPGLVLVCLK